MYVRRKILTITRARDYCDDTRNGMLFFLAAYDYDDDNDDDVRLPSLTNNIMYVKSCQDGVRDDCDGVRAAATTTVLPIFLQTVLHKKPRL